MAGYSTDARFGLNRVEFIYAGSTTQFGRMLNKERILGALGNEQNRVGVVHVFHEVDSTNNRLWEDSSNAITDFHLCFAESQTQGRGRHGHSWHSPHGGIYCSVLAQCNAKLGVWLGLMTAVEITVGFKQLGIEGIGVKWPNDIYCQFGKLGGVLVECRGDLSIVGVGINRTQSGQFKQSAGFAQLTYDIPEYNQLAALVAQSIMCAFDRVREGTVSEWVQKYQEVDFLQGRQVDILLRDGERNRGTACGINEEAGLCVRHDDNMQVYHAGEVSVRQ